MNSRMRSKTDLRMSAISRTRVSSAVAAALGPDRRGFAFELVIVDTILGLEAVMNLNGLLVQIP